MKARADDSDYHFANLVRETYWLLRGAIDARLEPMGLSHALWRPLLALHMADAPMTQVRLARFLGVESPTLVRLLDRLTERGWIVRRQCPGDRRAWHVALTPRAQTLCTDIERVVSQIRREALADVPAADLATTMRVLEQARDRFSAIAGQSPGPAPSASAPRHGARGRKRDAIE